MSDFPQMAMIRPFFGPMTHPPGWFDDFSVTGAKNVGYSTNVTYGVLVPEKGWVSLTASAINQSSWLQLPAYAVGSNFEMETVFRGVTGGTLGFRYRYLDSNNTMLFRISGSTIIIQRVVAGAFTTVFTSATLTTTQWMKFNLRVTGVRTEFWINDKLVYVADLNYNVGNKSMMFYAYDPSVIPEMEIQYIALRLL